jgi:hypothetical protein
MPAAAPIISALVANNVKGMVLRFALSLAISFITQKLFGPEAPPGAASANGGSAPDPGVKQRIPSDPSNKLPVVYGEDKVHGSIIYADISSDNQTMAFIIALCEGPIKGINDIYWDDYKLVFEQGEAIYGDGEEDESYLIGDNVIDAIHPDGSTDSWLSGNFKVVRFPHGGRCPEMEAFSTKWATGAENRTMPDVAYVYCELKYDREKQVTGLTSKLAFEIEGRIIRTFNFDKTLYGVSPKGGVSDNVFANPNQFTDAHTKSFHTYDSNQIVGYLKQDENYDGISVLPQKLLVPGGTYEIIDLGDNSYDLGDHIADNIPSYEYGDGEEAEVEFDFVQPGEQYRDETTGNYITFQPSVPDDGRRILNGLNIKNEGYDYTTSYAEYGYEAATRIWVQYTYQLNGVETKYYMPLVTEDFGDYSPVSSEQSWVDWFIGILYGGYEHDWGSTLDNPNGVAPWGIEGVEGLGRRRDRGSYHVADVNGVEPTFQYEPGQQYFTASVPTAVKAYAFGSYSQSPAECLIDYLTHYTYGCGQSIFDNDLDLETFYNHKLFCENSVTHTDPEGNSVSSQQYKTNGYANTGDDKDLNISDLVVNSQGILAIL